MPITHSVLALYGEVSNALAELNSSRFADDSERTAAAKARRRARNITGLTGAAGEIGWYGELFRYFGAPERRSEGSVAEPLEPPTLEDAEGEFQAIIDSGIADDDGLQASWASRAIEAAFVLDAVRQATPRLNFVPTLDRVIAAAPEIPGFASGGIVGAEDAIALASQIRADDTIETLAQLHAALSAPGSPVHPAIGTAQIDARLRKVKDEYCAVVSTSVDWTDITFGKLEDGINPVNWDNYFTGFFCSMVRDGENDYGWQRVRESVSGECGRYQLRTPLKFWSEIRDNGLFLNYDLCRDKRWGQRDRMVLVDNGYIWITKLNPDDGDDGVRIRTSKQLLISGMSATALAVMARTMGYATNAADMFRKLEEYTGPPPLDGFASSLKGTIPSPDTSTTWPVVIPELPADIRNELCRDTNRLIKDGLDIADNLVNDFSTRWNDGIDADDFDKFTDAMSAQLRGFTKDVFTTVTENFRPNPNADEDS